MPSNILNKISEKLSGHEDSPDNTSSTGRTQDNNYSSSKGRAHGQESQGDDYNQSFGSEKQAGRTTRSQTASGKETENYGQHQRGAYNDEMRMKNQERAYNQDSSWLDSGKDQNYMGRDNDLQDNSLNNNYNQSSMGGRSNDNYGRKQQNQQSSGRNNDRSMGDTLKFGSNNQNAQQEIDEGKDYLYNNM
ncbi:hypothetical protein QEN19_000345 [Hanseniaspora menglaensis]